LQPLSEMGGTPRSGPTDGCREERTARATPRSDESTDAFNRSIHFMVVSRPSGLSRVAADGAHVRGGGVVCLEFERSSTLMNSLARVVCVLLRSVLLSFTTHAHVWYIAKEAHVLKAVNRSIRFFHFTWIEVTNGQL
jgi:hypothetical protein